MEYNEDIYLLEHFNFNIKNLTAALEEACDKIGYSGGAVNCISLTKMPGGHQENPRGIYWTKPTSSGIEVQRKEHVDESKYTEFEPKLKDSYLYDVYSELCKHYKIGRVRILKLNQRSTLSWHRDPEPRIHIPIITNPGSIMVIDNFATHMPADGSAYFTNTRNYHVAFNGGEEARIHIVATVLDFY